MPNNTFELAKSEAIRSAVTNNVSQKLPIFTIMSPVDNVKILSTVSSQNAERQMKKVLRKNAPLGSGIDRRQMKKVPTEK